MQVKDETGQTIGRILSICYCRAACVIAHGARAWISAASNWAKDEKNRGCSLVAKLQDSFWQAVDSDEATKKLFVANGWEIKDNHIIFRLL